MTPFWKALVIQGSKLTKVVTLCENGGKHSGVPICLIFEQVAFTAWRPGWSGNHSSCMQKQFSPSMFLLPTLDRGLCPESIDLECG